MLGRPVTLRAWLSRGLLVLLVLFGLGLWQAGDCAEHTSPPATVAAVTASPAGLAGPSVLAGPCHLSAPRAVVPATPASVAIAPPAGAAGPRTVEAVARPVPPGTRRCPALTEIGISRT